MSDLREKLKEIVELVALVPESLQKSCFEMLLKDVLDQLHDRAPSPPNSQGKKNAEIELPISDPLEPEKQLEHQVGAQSDIGSGDVHMKAKRFLEKQGITMAQLNDLYYKEGSKIMPLIEDLQSTKMSETQVRIAMLQAFQNGLGDGEFVTTVEKVRAECKDRKAYDQTNFTAHFRNNAALFDFGTFSKEVTELRLSEEGKRDLSVLIKSLK